METRLNLSQLLDRENIEGFEWFVAPQIPEDEVYTAQVLITLTLDLEGTSSVYHNVRGNMAATSFLGLLEMGKLDIYTDSKENW